MNTGTVVVLALVAVGAVVFLPRLTASMSTTPPPTTGALPDAPSKGSKSSRRLGAAGSIISGIGGALEALATD